MKSPSPYPQKSAPSLSRREKQNQEVEQRINEILFHSMQLQRTLWLVTKASGGEITIDETATPPLWNLDYARDPTDKNKVIIRAALLPEPTDEQMEKLAASLIGKDTDPGAEMDKLGLSQYPKSYVVKALQSRIIFANGKDGKAGIWMKREEFEKISQEPPQPSTH